MNGERVVNSEWMNGETVKKGASSTVSPFTVFTVHRSPPFTPSPSSAAIGFFDGVHVGHRFLIKQLKELAASAGLPSAVITFGQHPRSVLEAGYRPALLTAPDEKLKRLSALGIDFCHVIDFTKELSQLSARDFIADVLCKKLRLKQLLVGYDHRFGKGRAESFPDYVNYGRDYGLKVVRALELPGFAEHVGSTLIRQQLIEGRLEEANRLLSYNYSLEGKVVKGNQLGRRIGFPTANIEVNDKCKVIPKEGIYAVWVHVGTAKYRGMAYIGKRPTVVRDGERRVEVHILDFSSDLYGTALRLEFVKFLREDRTFDDLSGLKNRLLIDRELAVDALREN
ncbi:MAG: riboflavin biosynthesis protein RibF [Dysgonamonadaceae bacterium]|jgi:riboflavin kinase/FMN adenylyltransferase|nr:riboflavin biosynthesis protein RibF [Dysgonamonadaceae bacterium]